MLLALVGEQDAELRSLVSAVLVIVLTVFYTL